jgi:anaerobic carbon-monoxide dehydrogenase iron sulfur subunit
MRTLVHDEDLCVGCHVCEEVCSETWAKVVDRWQSRIRVIGERGETQRATVCVQCGECIDVCATQAITRDRRGVVRVNKGLCVGCLACVGFCRYEAMFRYPGVATPFKCVACGRCVDLCPAGALSIEEREL